MKRICKLIVHGFKLCYYEHLIFSYSDIIEIKLKAGILVIDDKDL